MPATEGQMPQVGPNDLLIAVLGITGSGKSTFIARATGTDPEVGHGLQSCTSEVEVYQLKRHGRVIWLIDTPGFDDTNVSDADVLEDLAFWLSKSFQAGTLLSGMIYLHPISNNRMTGSAVKNVRIFKKLIGDKSLRCVVLASTMWGNVDEHEGVKREKELLRTTEFWGEMVEKGSKVFRHYDTQKSALEIIDDIVGKNIKTVLDLQEQMVNQGRMVNETEAGKEVESALLKEREKFERRMKENEEELKQALKNNDAKNTRELRKIQEQYQAQISKSTKAIEDMRVDMQRLHEQKEQAFRQEIEQLRMQNRINEDNMRGREMQLERFAQEFHSMRAYDEPMRQQRVPDERYYQEQMMQQRPPQERYFHEQTIVYVPVPENTRSPQQGENSSSQSLTQNGEDSRIQKGGKNRTQKAVGIVQASTAVAGFGLALAQNCGIM